MGRSPALVALEARFPEAAKALAVTESGWGSLTAWLDEWAEVVGWTGAAPTVASARALKVADYGTAPTEQVIVKAMSARYAVVGGSASALEITAAALGPPAVLTTHLSQH
jgi:hypothetical protein